MNLEEIIRFATQYFSDYFATSIATLVKPRIRFTPRSSKTTNKIIQVNEPSREIQLGAELDPRLYSFVLINIFLGVKINSLIPVSSISQFSSPDLMTTMAVIGVFWLIASSLIHLVCKILRGRGSYIDTLSICLQLISVLYVTSCFLTLVITSVSRFPYVIYPLLKNQPNSISFVTEEPIFTFFIVRFALFVIYFPLALREVHRFGGIRASLVSIIVAPIITFFVVAFFFVFHIPGMGPPADLYDEREMEDLLPEDIP